MSDDYHNIQKVKAAIITLYDPLIQPTQKSQANTWLEKFRQSEYAWQVCDNLLNHERNFENEDGDSGVGCSSGLDSARQNKFLVLFFAAQTLKQKIVMDFHQLPGDSYWGFGKILGAKNFFFENFF